MVKFGKIKIAKGKFYAAKRPIKIWDVNVNNIVISKLAKTKTNSKYLIGYLNKDIRRVDMLRNLKVKIESISYYLSVQMMRNYQKNIKLFGLRSKTSKNIKLNALPVYDDRYIKTKTRTYGDKVYPNFRGLNVPEGDKGCESFTVISIDSLLVYKKKYYLQAYLDNCAYKIVNKQMTDYLNGNIFEDQIL